MTKMAVVYWSGTGNTEAMAQAVAQGGKSAGAQVDLLSVEQAAPQAVAQYDRVALGCPAMGAEVLEESEFEPFYTGLEPLLRGKTVALFGSYGWGDGQWLRDWQLRAESAGVQVYEGEGLMLNEAPDAAGLEACRKLGEAFAQ